MNPQAMVTGASEGIGRAFAQALARAGYEVTAVARSQERLESLREGMAGSGHHLLVADLATTDGLQKAVTALNESRFTLLVNNAAFGAVGDFTQVPIAKQVEMIRLNVEALTVLAHAFLKQSERGDTLINLSSVVVQMPQPTQPVYSATKAFVTSLSETLWQQQRRRGVHVMAIHPGATDTPFAVRAGRGPNAPRPRFVRQIPEQVVAVTLRALDRRQGPNVVSGLPNRIFVTVARLMPRRLLLEIIARAAK